MMKLDPLMLEKPMEEIRCRNSKARLDKILEKNDFVSSFVRPILALSRMPLDDGARLEGMPVNEIGHSRFGQLALSPALCKIFYYFRLGIRLLRSHLEGREEKDGRRRK